MRNVSNPIYITSWYDKEEPSSGPQDADSTEVTSTTPAFSNILIKNVSSYGTPYNSNTYSYFPVYIYGRPEQHIKNVTFDNVKIHAAKGMLINFADNVSFINGCEIVDTTKTGTGRTKLYQSYRSSLTGTYDGTVVDINTAEIPLSSAGVKSVRYYDLSGRKVDSASGLVLRDIVYTDGRNKVDKMIIR